jgi:Icc-related predicted phosphoesterase
MKLVIISDTHRQENKVILPEGDILIHAGDFDIYDQNNLDTVIDWFKKLDYNHIIFTGGNHDKYLQHFSSDEINKQLPSNIHYLMNDSVVVNNIKFWGSPYSPAFGQGWAYNAFIDELREKWATIPSDTDIVISHCNCFGINDVVRGISQGCPALRDRIKEIKPKLHVSGHIHPGYGVYQDKNTIYVNASILDDFYQIANKPIIINYEN